jgi:hypothetical protein
MIAENPAPDNDTMETLIETNEILNKSMNQHQRALLNARKAAGLASGTPNNTPPPRTDSGFAAPPGPPPNLSKPTPPARKAVPPIPPPGDYAPTDADDENPFSDPSERPARPGKATHNPPFPEDKPPTATGQFDDRLGIEPWHPGFKETPSYMGRQDSAVGNTTMHAAAVGPPATERESHVERKKDDDEVTGYGAQPGTKAPIYRY